MLEITIFANILFFYIGRLIDRDFYAPNSSECSNDIVMLMFRALPLKFQTINLSNIKNLINVYILTEVR